MELKIEHLAPYLPYGISLQFVIREEIVRTGVMSRLLNYSHETHPVRVAIDNYDSEHIWMFKPILKPLSDLEKDVVVATNLEEVYDVSYNAVLHGVITFVSHEDPFDLEHLPLGAFTLLVKNHYDVFGLIEKNLAVNFNTIEK